MEEGEVAVEMHQQEGEAEAAVSHPPTITHHNSNLSEEEEVVVAEVAVGGEGVVAR